MVRALRVYILVAACLMAVVPQLLADEHDDAEEQEHHQHHHHRHKVPLSPRVIDMPRMTPGTESIQIRPVRRIPLPPVSSAPAAAPIQEAAMQTAPKPATPTIAGSNFEGLGIGFPGFVLTATPPDTDGAVGRTQYVQLVNTAFAVFDKATHATLAGPIATNTLFSALGAGNPCSTTNDGDGIVLYDHMADRWIISQFANAASATGPYYECIAISESADATQRFFLYFFSYSNFDDYPKIGIWPDAYYITYNAFQPPNSGGLFVGGIICALDRTSMLSGLSTRGSPGPGTPAGENQICFNTLNGAFLPADLDGANLPPAGSPEYLLSFTDSAHLGLFAFHVDFNTPANSTLNGVNFGSASNPVPTLISVNPFTPTCNGGTCIPQNGTAQVVDSLADRLMARLAYRNFGSFEALVANHSVQVDAAHPSGIRWYEIRSPGTTPTIAQTGDFAPDGNYRWMGSIAMDKFGNIAVGYSVSSPTIFPKIAYVGLPGTLADEFTMFAGAGSEVGSLGGMPVTRWGDYSAMSLDPEDDCTFWYTDEYFAASGIPWNTRIGNFKFAQCQSMPSVVTVTPSTGSGLGPVTFTFLYSDTGGAAQITTTQGVFNTGPSTATACAFQYNHTPNTLQLYQNDGVTLSAALAVGSGGTTSNTQCTLDATNSSVTPAGDSLVLNVRITFLAAFAGVKSTFMSATDSSGNTTGLQGVGTWTVP